MGINRAVTPQNQHLVKKLSLLQLIAFGMNYMMPFAPAIIFGAIAKASGTTVILPYLIALIIMSLTANSYIYMVKRNPVAGSLYSYVESVFGKRIGFLAGWILFLDYILIPTVVAISATLYLQQYLPEIPYSIILIVYVLITGAFNLFGISLVANLGLVILILMEVVLVLCLLILGKHAVSVGSDLFSLIPFEFSSYKSLFIATTLCVLSYLGYDAISTLAEEAKNPVKDVPKAIAISVIISGIMMALLGYLGILAFPEISNKFTDTSWLNSALFHIVQVSGGDLFTIFFTSGVIVCMIVFNIVSTAAGARLLFGMGRDRALPRSVFGQVSKKFKTPYYNIIIIMIIEIILGLSLKLDSIVDIVNFGAIFAFTILNYAVSYHIIFKEKKGDFWKKSYVLIPVLGVISMIIMLTLMETKTLLIGSIWSILGIVLMLGNKYLKQYNKINNTNVSQVNNENVIVQTAPDQRQLILLKDYWNYDHWNISETIIETLLDVQPDSMITLKNNEETIGTIVAYNYNSTVSYFGLFYIRSEFRGKNYGAYLTGAALQTWQSRAVACDSVYSQVLKYKKLGFVPIYENKRYVFIPKAKDLEMEEYESIIPASEVDINNLIDYDAKHFYCKRPNIIRNWVDKNKKNSFVYLSKDNKIQGYICVTKAYEAYRITPLFADSADIAKKLIYKISKDHINQLVNIDIPNININKDELVKEFDMIETSLKLVRMHKGTLDINNINNTYGHLSIEIG